MTDVLELGLLTPGASPGFKNELALGLLTPGASPRFKNEGSVCSLHEPRAGARGQKFLGRA